MRARRIIAVAVVAMLSPIGGPPEAGARNRGSIVRQSQVLQPTGLDDDARGRARLQVRGGSDGRFELRVSRLDGDSTYEVLVDEVRVGAIRTHTDGSGRLRLRSRPRSDREGFLGFDPRGMMLLVRGGAGDVLAASIASGTAASSGAGVICCVPDDSGPECEDRTTDECVAAGGTVSAAASCLPNPCAGTPPPAAEVVCCIPDDSGPECEDRTPGECAIQGGVVVAASSCAPNPCGATVPADLDIRCCLSDDSGAQCEDRTPAECEAQGGVNLGAGSCTPNPCAGVLPPPPVGGAASVRVRCERRASRSRISVDGSGLAAGSYRARAVSGTSDATSAFAAAVGGQAEFDFDSDGGDIAAGATPIAASFIQGNPAQVLGQILDVDGAVVAEAAAVCEIR